MLFLRPGWPRRVDGWRLYLNTSTTANVKNTNYTEWQPSFLSAHPPSHIHLSDRRRRTLRKEEKGRRGSFSAAAASRNLRSRRVSFGNCDRCLVGGWMHDGRRTNAHVCVRGETFALPCCRLPLAAAERRLE